MTSVGHGFPTGGCLLADDPGRDDRAPAPHPVGWRDSRDAGRALRRPRGADAVRVPPRVRARRAAATPAAAGARVRPRLAALRKPGTSGLVNRLRPGSPLR